MSDNIKLPTFFTIGNFHYDKHVKLTEEDETMLKDKRAIDILSYQIKKKINNTGSENRFYILEARTGSGKSTIMIKELYDQFIRNEHKTILVSEPRITLCVSNPTEIERWSTNNDKIGKNIGYLTGLIRTECNNKEIGSLYYCTAQIVTNKLNKLLQNDKLLDSNIRIIVIDEAHLLEIQVLELLALIHDILLKYGDDPRCPLFIVCSATLDVDSFVSYYLDCFPKFKNKDDLYSDPSMIGYVSGLTNYPITTRYEEVKLNGSQNIDEMSKYSIMRHISNKLSKIVKNNLKNVLGDIENKGNDVLLFVPKTIMINNVIGSLSYIIGSDYPDIPVFSINQAAKQSDFETWRDNNRKRLRILLVGYARGFSSISDEIMKYSEETDKECREYERKIFVTTPIIESGKTISTLRYLYDTGLVLSPVYIPLSYDPMGFTNLCVSPINKAMATQREGRIGREQPGECIRLYSKNLYDQLDEQSLPETVNNYCISYILVPKFATLQLYSKLDIFNFNNFMYPMSYDIILRNTNDLIRVGFFSLFGYISDYITTYKDFDRTIFYIQYLYYVKEFSLFDSVMFVMLNDKIIRNELYPHLSIKYDSAKDFTVKTDDLYAIERIKEGRNLITRVLYDPTYSVIRYLYNRIF